MRGELLDPAERLGHERLPRVAGMDAHAEDDVGASLARRRGSRVDAGLGVECEADREAVHAGARRDRRGVVGDLDVEGDRVGARGGELLEVVGGIVDHQVAVEHAARRVDPRCDRPEHDRSHRDRRDEMPVADVEVEDPAARLEQCVDLLPEPAEVGGVERRLELRPVPDPVAPPHGAILRSRPAERRRSRSFRGRAAASAGSPGASGGGTRATGHRGSGRRTRAPLPPRRRRSPRSPRRLTVQVE